MNYNMQLSDEVKIDFRYIGYIHGKVEPVTKVPYKSYSSLNEVEIPKIVIDDLVNLIEKILSNIKKIKWKKNKNFVYVAEYYPIEGMEINANERIHRVKFWLGIAATSAALQRFPNNNYVDDMDDDILPSPIIPGGIISFQNWFKMELMITVDQDKDCYLLQINRISGEGFSFYSIYEQIKQHIEESILWLMRKNYINLLEGLHIVPGKENHIERYLLDEYVCREICSCYGY